MHAVPNNPDGHIVQQYLDRKKFTYHDFLSQFSALGSPTAADKQSFSAWKNRNTKLSKRLVNAGVKIEIENIVAQEQTSTNPVAGTGHPLPGASGPLPGGFQAVGPPPSVFQAVGPPPSVFQAVGPPPSGLQAVGPTGASHAFGPPPGACDVDELCRLIGNISLNEEYYTYLWIDLSVVYPWNNVTLLNFAKCIFYVGKGKGNRYLHNDATTDQLKIFAERRFKNSSGVRFYICKIPFTDLNESEAKWIESKLIECLQTKKFNKHLKDNDHSNHRCEAQWTHNCLFNSKAGDRVRGDVRAFYSSKTGEELLEIALNYFLLNVFSNLQRNNFKN